MSLESSVNQRADALINDKRPRSSLTTKKIDTAEAAAKRSQRKKWLENADAKGDLAPRGLDELEGLRDAESPRNDEEEKENDEEREEVDEKEGVKRREWLENVDAKGDLAPNAPKELEELEKSRDAKSQQNDEEKKEDEEERAEVDE